MRPLIVRWREMATMKVAAASLSALCPRAEAEVRHLLLFPTFFSLMSSQCDSPRDSIQTLLPQRAERSQPPIEASLQGFSSQRG